MLFDTIREDIYTFEVYRKSTEFFTPLSYQLIRRSINEPASQPVRHVRFIENFILNDLITEEAAMGLGQVRDYKTKRTCSETVFRPHNKIPGTDLYAISHNLMRER